MRQPMKLTLWSRTLDWATGSMHFLTCCQVNKYRWCSITHMLCLFFFFTICPNWKFECQGKGFSNFGKQFWWKNIAMVTASSTYGYSVKCNLIFILNQMLLFWEFYARARMCTYYSSQTKGKWSVTSFCHYFDIF